ncbi:MAG TPA: dihydropteroate synthase [Elusimicrobia bacterium]|nr:dihydropteroate synthase [Elusimicrobiota bacterium]
MPSSLASVSSEKPRAAGLRRPLLMGVLNATPDSFYAGSRVPALEEAVSAGRRMEEEGADLLDLGGESTRPGAEAVSDEEETRRIVPLVEALSRSVSIPLSVDTSKASVARRALDAGAAILNDVTALRGDPRMPAVARRYRTVVLMHMLGTPRTMQDDPRYGDVAAEVAEFLKERTQDFERSGGEAGRVWLDPGLGFGKTVEHNLELISRIQTLMALGRPVLVGASRKSFIGRLLGTPEAPLPPELRLEGSLAVACWAASAGVHALRVHDVAQTRRTLDMFVRLGKAA